jgi:TonB family protein
MTPGLLANVVAYSCQLALIAAAAGLVAAALRPRRPGLLLVHYRAALAVGLTLPLVALTGGPDAALSPLELGSLDAASIQQRLPAPSRSLLPVVLSAGCVLRLCWLAVGLASLRWQRRAARPLGEAPEPLAALEQALGVSAQWYVSDGLEGAATYGIRRPVVLLPARVMCQPAPVLQMVACHELFHVRRRDWILVVAEEMVRAALWFHPGVWFLLDRIQLHREQVVDEQVIAMLGNRRAYASALLDGARQDWSPRPRLASGWLLRSHVRARIVAIVNGGTMSNTNVIRATLIMVTMGIALTASAVTAVRAFPLQSSVANGQGQRVYLPGDAVTLPRLVTEVKPQYTPEALQEKIEGSLLLSVVVEADGSVGDISVVQSLDTTFGLDDQGVDAARQWTFEPGTKDGIPVAVQVAIEMTFTLK